MRIHTAKRFQDPNYRNWVKLFRAQEILRVSLRVFVHESAEKLWYDIIVTWIKSHERCLSCKASDVTFNARRVPKIKCWSLQCPNNVCNKWLGEIIRNHAYGHSDSVQITNCDVTRWPLDTWEFAKAFMSKIGHCGLLNESRRNSIKPNDTDQRVLSSNSVNQKQTPQLGKDGISKAQSNRVSIGGRTMLVGKRRGSSAKQGKHRASETPTSTTSNSTIERTDCVKTGNRVDLVQNKDPTAQSLHQKDLDRDVIDDHVLAKHDEKRVTLQHLLSFLINCSTLHTAYRKSHAQAGGLTARHVIRIKKVRMDNDVTFIQGNRSQKVSNQDVVFLDGSPVWPHSVSS